MVAANPIKLKRVWGPHVNLSQGSSPTEDLAGGSAQDPGDEDTDLLALKNRRRSEALRDTTAVDSETASHLLGGRRPFQFSPKAAFGIRRCGAAPSTHNSGQISRSHSKLDLQQGERVQCRYIQHRPRPMHGSTAQTTTGTRVEVRIDTTAIPTTCETTPARDCNATHILVNQPHRRRHEY